MKRALAIISQVGFNDKELLTIKSTLEKNNISCVIASFAQGECIGKYGKRVTARYAIPSVNIDEFDALFFVGGYGISALMEYEQVIKLIKKANRAKKIIGAHCLAPALVLAKAGLLKGKNVTVFHTKDGWSAKEVLAHGAKLINAPVVTDKNIITGRNEDEAKAFADALVIALTKRAS